MVAGAVYGAAWRTGAVAALRWLQRDRLPILCYHSIIDGPPPPWAQLSGGLHLPVTQFRQQLDFLARHYQVVSLATVVDDLVAGRRPPRRSVVITFDDGYANNLTVAAPLLREYRFPATIFLATEYLGRNLFWWDDFSKRVHGRVSASAAREHGQAALRAATLDERAYLLSGWGADPGRDETVRPATWGECRAAPDNIQFGGHGAAHRVLDEISVTEARADLEDCQRSLRTELGPRAVPLFCYPAGKWTGEVRASLRAAGFTAAVTASSDRRGQRLARPGDELTLLPRIGVTSAMSLAAFAAKLSGI